MEEKDFERQLFDVIISTNSESNLDIDFKFVYNTYAIDEKTIDDNLIFDSGLQKRNRYIEISSSEPVRSLPLRSSEGIIRDRSGSSIYKKFYDYEESVEIQDNINQTFIKEDLTLISKANNNKNLSEQESIFFNDLCDYDHSKAFFYNKTKSDDLNLMNFYSLEEGDINNFSFIQNNSKSFVQRSEIFSILENEQNHFLPSQNEISILESYDSIVGNSESGTDITNRIFSGDILGGFNVFKQKQINYPQEIKSFTQTTKIGFLITKYERIESDNNDFEKKAEIFILSEDGTTCELSVKDDNVIYDKTYIYKIQEVYLYRRLIDDVLNYYLFCEYPFFTEEIVCEETKNPEPPVALSAEYDMGKKQLILNWENPTNDQNDAKGFQILKRNSLEEPFVVLTQIESHFEFETFKRKENILEEVITKSPGISINSFIDKNFNRSKVQIYAARTIDAHGNLSLYSSQIAVLYNPIENKLTVDLISKSGAPIDMPNLLIPRRTVLFENENFSVSNLPIASDIKKVTLYITPEFVNISDNETQNNAFNTLDEKYKFTMTKLNTLTKYEKEIKIKNFSLRDLN
jgi:hypothetical protein